jgi:hypothetical protein
MAPCKADSSAAMQPKCTWHQHPPHQLEFYIKKTVISACQYEYEMLLMREDDKRYLTCIPETR